MGTLGRLPLDDDAQYNGETVFLRGSRSGYVNESTHARLIKQHFPRATIATLDAGHWVHHDQPGGFVDAVVALVEASMDGNR